jgi:hypothetical protein
MGLIERRARHLLETETIPTYENDIKELAPGATTKLEIDWDSLGEDREAWTHISESSRSAIYNSILGSTMWCLDDIGRDAIGKAAIVDGLKAIRIVHKRTGQQATATFENGVLTITGDCTIDAQPEPAMIKTLLENGL